MVHKSVADLAMIARSGGGFTLDGNRYSASDLAMIGRNLRSKAQMIVTSSDRFDASDLAMIARNVAGTVIFS